MKGDILKSYVFQKHHFAREKVHQEEEEEEQRITVPA